MTEKSESSYKKEGCIEKWDRCAVISTLSRDVRVPLNVIISMSELLALSDSLNDKDWDYANMIYSASKNLLQIMDDIVDYSHYSQGEFTLENESYSVLKLVNEIEKDVQAKTLEKNLLFNVSIDPRIPEKVIGDAGKVKQIILNLLNNAVQYTDVGFVELKVGYKPVDDTSFQLVILVSDSGIGIKQENIDTVFDDFAKSNSKSSHTKAGTGLALAITRQLCVLMDGKITVTSEYGKGSTFAAFIVQKIDPDIEKEEKIISLSDNFESGKYIAPDFKVLAVDDNKVGLRVIGELLKQYGIIADTVTSGQDALNFIVRKKYDLVFMDYLMPEMNGKETTAKIRELDNCSFEELPIVALTADADRATKDELLECGMNDYLSKPVSSDDLKKIINKYVPLDMRQYNG